MVEIWRLGDNLYIVETLSKTVDLNKEIAMMKKRHL
jgi:hypothetical protein